MNNQVEYNEFKTRADNKSRHSQGLTRADYTLLDPVKFRTDTRGYWTDNLGKVYKDNLIKRSFNSWQAVKVQAVKLCKDKTQLCIFIKGARAGYIVDPKGKVIIFKSKRIISLSSWGAIRQAIRQYKSGITIYRTVKGYYAEVYFKGSIK